MKGEGANAKIKWRNQVSMANVTNINIKDLTLFLAIQNSLIVDNNAAIKITDRSRGVVISNSRFINDVSRSETNRAVLIATSTVTFIMCSFEGLSAYSPGDYQGGAIHARSSHIVLSGSTFIMNRAHGTGGAIAMLWGSITLNGTEQMNQFHHNFCNAYGGAIECQYCTIIIVGRNEFINNSIPESGGAISVLEGTLNVLSGQNNFTNNAAKKQGGAVALIKSNATFYGSEVFFEGNSAEQGGGICIIPPQQTPYELVLDKYEHALISAHFINNRGKCGGAVAVNPTGDVTFVDATFIGNHDSALWSLNATIRFKERIEFSSNIGGAIYSSASDLLFSGTNSFFNNTGEMGGAIKIDHGTLVLSQISSFTYNRATDFGGAIYAFATTITLNNSVHFSSNSARRGGVIYIFYEVTLYLEDYTLLYTSENNAAITGGAIHHEDTYGITPARCALGNELGSLSLRLPPCFLQLAGYNVRIESHNDRADGGGDFMFGGFLDQCQLVSIAAPRGMTPYDYFIDYRILVITSRKLTKSSVSSEPYRLCFCDDNELQSCIATLNVVVRRGQEFTLPLVALGQGNGVTSTLVRATTSNNARLGRHQGYQSLPLQCSELSYTVYSNHEREELTIYANGPCKDAGAVVSVTLLPCPDAFVLQEEECVCEVRLQAHSAECITRHDNSYISINKHGSTLWISGHYNNGSYIGLVLCETCPVEYCKVEPVAVTLDNIDVQCALNRSGVLCGSCAANHSLLLGSSRCAVCSDTYLALLILFAAAGVVLVAFLTFLKLTVATGMLNSLILYANIVQVNRKLFFPVNTVNVLTVFIAWLNLDLGFEICFYNGMDAYAQTWLQFVFPIFVWIIISLIIFTSRYSIIASRLIGSNPIAVLATLLLMSYTKILKVIIEVYSSVNLDYPGNKKVTVWLKDGNVLYLQSQEHLILTVITSLVLIIFFLPYTLLLTLGYKFYRFTGKRYFNWFNKMKPLLESYYAPYETNTRYWPGAMLLIRCALYIVFSYNSLGGANKSLLAIIIILTAMVSKVWFSTGKVYRKFYVNAIEVAVHSNLIVLSAVTLAKVNTEAAVYSLVGIIFVIMIGTVVYHFHILYISRTVLWLKIKGMVPARFQNNPETPNAAVDIQFVATPSPSGGAATTTIVEVREPLLA